MKQKDTNIIFHSVITSERHRQIGYCESSDFGSINLISISPLKKELVVSFMDYDKPQEYVSYNNMIYKKIVKGEGINHLSREEEEKYIKLQGKFTEKTALKLVLELRKRMENTFSWVDTKSFLLIGKTLYSKYCKPKDLTITVCGNLAFSCWLSINFEAHGNKVTHKLNKSNFEKVFLNQKKRFEEAKPKEGRVRGDGHVAFSYPKKIVWGAKYKH